MVPSCLPGVSLVPPRLSKWSFPASLVPPSASQAVQLVLSCLPGASQAVQLVLSCLPGAPLVPRRLSNWSFPASLVPPRLSKWSFPASLVSSRSFPASLVPPRCLAGCRSCLPGASWAVQNGPFLPPWCLPGASQAGRLSNWSESRFWTGAGFCLNFNTTSMANGPVRGKSWSGPHGRLPVAQAGL